ncbi:Haem-NO-binding [Albimonas donghaensis]|uniref:Haem-NO-binding n=1 Tax=Albimonas donghaensis TaxID=356660 RepID=A0A1H3AY79_9RHOB|nr:heme NO-binding domain-containing protein [Albimonas donghaensis]SDX34686.1 Haem-NO-binding [Albimonas donghaensis]
MYGLVNNGVKAFILGAHGQGAWDSICAQAGLSGVEFESMVAYDDDLTYRLVGAVADHLGLPAATVLEVFGHFWVDFSRDTSVGRLMVFEGATLVERLRNLDEMHERVKLVMPHLEPPSFEFEPVGEGLHRLHYYSAREGLQPMVIGLLHGLAAESGERVEIDHVARRDDGADHDVFELRMLDAAAAAGDELGAGAA